MPRIRQQTDSWLKRLPGERAILGGQAVTVMKIEFLYGNLSFPASPCH